MILAELKTGDVVFTYRNKFLSKTIRLFTKDAYSHMGVVVVVEKVPYLFEAQAKGIIHPRITKAFLDRDSILIKRPTFDFKPSMVTTEAMTLTGTRYDYKELIIGQGLSQLYQNIFKDWRWFGNKKKRAANRFYCFEFVAYIYRKVFPLWWKLDPYELINSPYFKEIKDEA